jgi:hypothetical protein
VSYDEITPDWEDPENPDTLEWARRTSREVQAAHAAGVSPDYAMERIREAAARKRELAAAADPDAWLAEYRKVMAEPLSPSGKELDRVAPYAPDPIPGLPRLIAATTPPSRRARRKDPDARRFYGHPVLLSALIGLMVLGLCCLAMLLTTITWGGMP